MILKIYLDILFLENFLMDYILLLLTGKILQKQKRRLGLPAAAVIGGGYTILYYILLGMAGPGQGERIRAFLQLGNLITSYGMIRLAYVASAGRQGIICLITIWVLSFAAGGILTWIQDAFPGVVLQRSRILMGVGALTFGYLFLRKWMDAMKERLHVKRCHLAVQITMGGKQVCAKGLLDSGNSLYEPITGRPVVIVEQELLLSNGILLPDTFWAIPYHAIGTQKGILKGVLADELEIQKEQGEKKWYKVMLGIYEGTIDQKGEYQVILHPRL